VAAVPLGATGAPAGQGEAAAPRAIAVFGGSFNPPHIAHVMACLYVAETQPVDAVWVIPAFRHPFEKQLAPFEDRLEMCRLALEILGPRVSVAAIERDIATADGTPSRTLDTIEALIERHPGVTWRLVIGADILRERGKWYRWDELERLAPPIVLGRQGYDAPAELGPLVTLPAISSTEVRARLSRGESAADLVPRRVLEYVSRRGLYRSP
jgi:nicotinate-nucleotide adenylyltransferase